MKRLTSFCIYTTAKVGNCKLENVIKESVRNKSIYYRYSLAVRLYRFYYIRSSHIEGLFI